MSFTDPPLTPEQPLQAAIRLKREVLDRLDRQPVATWPEEITQFVSAVRGLDIRDSVVLLTLFTDVAEELRTLGERHFPQGASEYRLGTFWNAARSELPLEGMLAVFERELIAWVTRAPERHRQRSQHVQRVKEFIRERYAEPLTLKAIAESVGRREQYVATLFRREVRLTVHNYLTRVRMRRAWDLIRRGEKIEAVSLLVGYRSKKNFYRQFKAHVGMTPGRCQETWMSTREGSA